MYSSSFYRPSPRSLQLLGHSPSLIPTLDGVKSFIEEGRMADYQDHYYPSEMSVDAQIQTFLMKGDVDAFLTKFDTDWKRYNRDIIRKVEDYEKEHADED